MLCVMYWCGVGVMWFRWCVCLVLVVVCYIVGLVIVFVVVIDGGCGG